MDTVNYFIVKKKAMPDIYLKVVQAKKMLESAKVMTVQEAINTVGISRSSFYKYKDMIFPFYENTRGKIITITLNMDDEPGLLAIVLQTIANYRANILTIHQSIPINGVASISISIEVLTDTGNIEEMINSIESKKGIHQIKILARE